MSYRCVRRFAVVVVFAALGLALLPAPADADSPAQPRLVSAITAQQSSATGDLAWSFSRRYIFADERVATAFAILIDEPQVIEAAGLEGQGLVYSDDEIRAAAEGQPVESAEVLLAAGGVAAPRSSSRRAAAGSGRRPPPRPRRLRRSPTRSEPPWSPRSRGSGSRSIHARLRSAPLRPTCSWRLRAWRLTTHR